MRVFFLAVCIALCIARTGIVPRLEHVPSLTHTVEMLGHFWCGGIVAYRWGRSESWRADPWKRNDELPFLRQLFWWPAMVEAVLFFGQKFAGFPVNPWLDRLF